MIFYLEATHVTKWISGIWQCRKHNILETVTFTCAYCIAFNIIWLICNCNNKRTVKNRLKRWREWKHGVDENVAMMKRCRGWKDGEDETFLRESTKSYKYGQSLNRFWKILSGLILITPNTSFNVAISFITRNKKTFKILCFGLV